MRRQTTTLSYPPSFFQIHHPPLQPPPPSIISSAATDSLNIPPFIHLIMADAALDMSLSDLIKRNKKSGDSDGRDRGPASGPGPAHRFNNRDVNRSTPYGTTKVD
ncbi:hypothetical protein HanIR_Chr13g0642121 [Helianthus annuus]|nr:hypothetical protein HanIR_Chr13g0642121 [Helianthus annuus]